MGFHLLTLRDQLGPNNRAGTGSGILSTPMSFLRQTLKNGHIPSSFSLGLFLSPESRPVQVRTMLSSDDLYYFDLLQNANQFCLLAEELSRGDTVISSMQNLYKKSVSLTLASEPEPISPTRRLPDWMMRLRHAIRGDPTKIQDTGNATAGAGGQHHPRAQHS